RSEGENVAIASWRDIRHFEVEFKDIDLAIASAGLGRSDVRGIQPATTAKIVGLRAIDPELLKRCHGSGLRYAKRRRRTDRSIGSRRAGGGEGRNAARHGLSRNDRRCVGGSPAIVGILRQCGSTRGGAEFIV